MSDGKARRTRPALRLARDEPDQVPRLLAFRTAHPHVIIGAGEFGVWQAAQRRRYRLCLRSIRRARGDTPARTRAYGRSRPRK